MTYLQQVGTAGKFETEGGAFYPVSVSAASKYVVGDPWYQVREKAFNVNWHPGPLGHTLIASSIAHFMLANMKIALHGDTARKGNGPSLDNPLVGVPPLSGVSNPPQCGSIMPKQCHTGMLPTTEGARLESHVERRSGQTWEYSVSKEVVGGHDSVDTRMVFRGTKKDGELKLAFEASDDGQYVVLCGAPCGWNCNDLKGWVPTKSNRWWKDKEHPRQNVSDLSYTIDGREVSSLELLELYDYFFDAATGEFCPNCENPANVCQPVAKVSKGWHTVGARVEPRTWVDGTKWGHMHVEILQLMVVG